MTVLRIPAYAIKKQASAYASLDGTALCVIYNVPMEPTAVGVVKHVCVQTWPDVIKSTEVATVLPVCTVKTVQNPVIMGFMGKTAGFHASVRIMQFVMRKQVNVAVLWVGKDIFANNRVVKAPMVRTANHPASV